MHPLHRLFNHARQYRKDAWIASLYSLLNKIFDVLPEILIGVAVDVVVNRKESFLAGMGVPEPRDQLILLALLTVIIWVGESLFQYLYDVRWRNLAQNLQHDLRMEAYQHVQKLELAYFERNRTGNLLAILNEDINQMERFFNGGFNSLIQVFFGSLMVGGVFFFLTKELAFLALIPVPFILYGAFWFQSRLASRYTSVREAAGALATRLNNNLQGIATVKAYAAEDIEVQHISDASNVYRHNNAEAIRLSAAITPVIRMAILAGFTVTLLYGGFMTLKGELGVGSYSALVYLTQRLLWPLTGLAELTDLYQRSMASIQRVMNLLDTRVSIEYAGQALPIDQVKGDIRFENIDFSYENSGINPALQQFNLHIAAGSNIAFVGTTGGGKSTITKLLLRFYEPQGGEIRLDGANINGLNLQELRRAIGYVAQDTFLADASIAENISYGQLNAKMEDIIAAAKAAEAHEFIENLPNGYLTQVGERGMKLSGGQRQRLALARAILKNPPILILDEATSAVDNETEAAIQRSLEKLVVGRTSIIIAHRLSTVRHADCINVLERGRIIESGTHAELLSKGGVYADLWRLQTGELGAHVSATLIEPPNN
ncbi:ABC transporter ATP-binding protein/permease [Methylobacillus gramineus]|uniref:ABC transporter ATP-binding protein n=1 Tax=Methylobacillus gramineus TaxID=755169 RepID=UPI001CFF5630|nr:ABC transporter ATP-binding protein [Methylobacillus gramineus]MCB5184386.1 ABC transporter ATP-binding protein/permease [Methylobacillus gramineus]